MGLIRVRAEKNVWYEPMPGKGKLYLKGEEFMVDEEHFSDSKETKVKDKGGKELKFRGSMTRVLPEPVVTASVEKPQEAKAASRKVI